MGEVTFIIYFCFPGKEEDNGDFVFANTAGNKTVFRWAFHPSTWLFSTRIREMLLFFPSSDNHLLLFHGDWGIAEQRMVYIMYHLGSKCSLRPGNSFLSHLLLFLVLTVKRKPSCVALHPVLLEKTYMKEKKGREHTNGKRPIFC